MANDEQVPTYVDTEKKKEIRTQAAMRDMSMAEWVREAIEEKLEREAGNSGNSTPSKQPAD